MQSLRIAVLASNALPLPPDPEHMPKGWAGAAERIMWDITEGLVERGHDVTLYASGDSVTRAKLVSVYNRASLLDRDIGVSRHIELEHLLIGQCYKDAQEKWFDVIHSSFDIRTATYAPLVSVPTVSTLHSPLDGRRKLILEKIPHTQYYVSISNNQRNILPDLRYIATIYHGIDPSVFVFNATGGDSMVLAGRIHPVKGFLEAAILASDRKRTVWLLGSFERDDDPYWKQVAERIDRQYVFWEGTLSRKELACRYGTSKVFLFPLQWEEPFGLVMIEAMACGTPVIAFARGSVPEIVVDGETGFIVNYSDSDKRGDWIIKQTGLEGMKEAIECIYSLTQEQYQAMRRACRARVEKFFTVDRMVSQYEEVYQRILQK